jgi:hypothetical protein
MLDGTSLSLQLAALDEVGEEMLRLESRLGCVTPTALFE